MGLRTRKQGFRGKKLLAAGGQHSLYRMEDKIFLQNTEDSQADWGNWYHILDVNIHLGPRVRGVVPSNCTRWTPALSYICLKVEWLTSSWCVPAEYFTWWREEEKLMKNRIWWSGRVPALASLERTWFLLPNIFWKVWKIEESRKIGEKSVVILLLRANLW